VTRIRSEGLRGERIPEKFIATRDIKTGETFTRDDCLNQREVEVLRALTAPDRVRAAAQLKLCPGSIKSYVNSIGNKVGVHRSMQLVLWGIKHGIIHADGRNDHGSHTDTPDAAGPQAASLR
jgi:DNA-binding NarL/FixJ family response regulator